MEPEVGGKLMLICHLVNRILTKCAQLVDSWHRDLCPNKCLVTVILVNVCVVSVSVECEVCT